MDLSVTPEARMWASLRTLTMHWQSDLKFFEVEIRFLGNLINRFYAWIENEENIRHTKSVASKLKALEQERQRLAQGLTLHLLHFDELVENPFAHDSSRFREEHMQHEKEIKALVDDFRATKREVFALTERVMESENVRHLIAKR